MVLGQLAERGPLHGHEIRRRAERSDVAEWGGVPIGSLYRELHRCEDQALITAVRTEQVGRRPARTIYAITDEGRRELGMLREQALREFIHPPDAVGVALLFAGGVDPTELAELLAPRRRYIAQLLQTVAAERDRYTASGKITATGRAVFRRGELRMQAELRWYDEWIDQLTTTTSSAEDNSTAPAVQPTERASQ